MASDVYRTAEAFWLVFSRGGKLVYELGRSKTTDARDWMQMQGGGTSG